MSSKNIETSTQPKRVWSISRRFTLFYLTSTAALLFLAAGFLYWTLRRNLDQTRHGLLGSKIEVLRRLLRQQPEQAQTLASEIEHEAPESQPFKYYVRLLDDHHRLLLETPGMRELPGIGLFPEPVSAQVEPLRHIKRKTWGTRSLLLLSITTPLGHAGLEQRIMQIALDVSPGTALLADYRNKLFMALGISLVLAAVNAVWIARKSLRPLVEITETAQRITPSQLHERIAPARWPAELANLASAFDAMLNRLEDSFNRLSQCSADLAHELRTPINNLRGEAEVALARPRIPEEYQQILTSSLEEYDRLSRMIDGLLFLARSDDPKAAIQHIPFDARKEIDAVREFYEALAEEKKVRVSCDGQARLIGDPVLFRRAVSNLLANALQHTSPPGFIHLSLLPAHNQNVELVVADTGTGIAQEHLPKIFNRFYRAGQPRSQTPAGTGLGLAIVQSILRLHGGTATIQSTLGKGTTVILRFPTTTPPS